MATGAQVRAKIKAVLADLRASSRTVKFREVTYVGGNSMLGVGGTATETLTVVTPVPAVETVTAEEVNSSGGLLQPSDYRLTFDGTIAEANFRTKQLVYGDEVLNIVHFEPYTLRGVIVAWGVIGRTVRPRT